MNLLLKGGTIVSPESSIIADIRIQEGLITEIGKNLPSLDSTIMDVSGKLLFPGFIDTHTHFDLDAGDFFTADNFYTGTKAAIAGGTTTILDFTTQEKHQTLAEALQNWHKKAEGFSSCDYGFHMSITDWNEASRKEIKEMTKAGVTSYKLYMAYDNLKVDDGKIYEIIKAVKEEGGIIGVHCENGDLINELIKEQKEQGNLSPNAHPLSRPDDIEAEAISRLLTIAKLADAPINIVHLSTKKGYDIIKKAREEGQKVYIETCPQYLLLDDSYYDLKDFESAKYVLSPPLRKKDDQECLWKALEENQIDTMGTDHCSFNFIGHKDRGRNDFSKIPNGIPGAEHRPVLLYTYGVVENKITKEQMCAVLSTNPAKLFGMYPQKGVIKEGSQADIVVWDTDYKWLITSENQLQNVDYTPYEGFQVTGRAEHVFLRGNLVVTNGEVIQEKIGSYVQRGKSRDTF